MRVAEGDISPSIPMVLFLCDQNTLSDGWYKIKFKISHETKLMKRISVGSKLLVSNLELQKGEKASACHPLENKLIYSLSSNSVKLARWDLKLGQWNEDKLGQF